MLKDCRCEKPKTIEIKGNKSAKRNKISQPSKPFTSIVTDTMIYINRTHVSVYCSVYTFAKKHRDISIDASVII